MNAKIYTQNVTQTIRQSLLTDVSRDDTEKHKNKSDSIPHMHSAYVSTKKIIQSISHIIMKSSEKKFINISTMIIIHIDQIIKP